MAEGLGPAFLHAFFFKVPRCPHRSLSDTWTEQSVDPSSKERPDVFKTTTLRSCCLSVLALFICLKEKGKLMVHSVNVPDLASGADFLCSACGNV